MQMIYRAKDGKPHLQGQRCTVIIRPSGWGKAWEPALAFIGGKRKSRVGNCLVEFEDGRREIVSFWSIAKAE
ncbi:hypothetical protein IB262_21210 [Ensifer sp. ENS02]|uniref:hypothetical protein n=1 Tax=Ensifer sp. ENS02 TaxID=2769290 RepID=UPI0017822F39|nr:hypothetical protein [Ensifer sp. ENS02]MBD9522418.1 hypothetical protein [Ensifer sp. ENS02]